MKHAKGEKSTKKPIVPIILIVLLVACITVAAFNGFGQKDGENTAGEMGVASTSFDTVRGDEVKQAVDGDNVEVYSSYMTLSYPSEYAGKIKVEESALEVGSTVVFRGTIGTEEVALYAIHFGGSSGDPVGVINTSDGYFMDVTVEFSDFVPGEDWPDSDVDEYGAMQETLNYVTQSMAENPNFETV